MKKNSHSIKPKYHSIKEILHLHGELNNELERFHKYLEAAKNYTLIEAIQHDFERTHIYTSIKDINSRVQQLTDMHKQKLQLQRNNKF